VVAAGGMPDQSSGSVIASIQVLYEGNVQGIGFRYSVRQIAKGFDITGSVRNLRDGRVELLVTGEEDEVRAFVEAIGQSELHSHIKRHSEAPLGNPPAFNGFEIRHD
jgi:acylphosphatase